MRKPQQHHGYRKRGVNHLLQTPAHHDSWPLKCYFSSKGVAWSLQQTLSHHDSWPLSSYVNSGEPHLCEKCCIHVFNYNASLLLQQAIHITSRLNWSMLTKILLKTINYWIACARWLIVDCACSVCTKWLDACACTCLASSKWLVTWLNRWLDACASAWIDDWMHVHLPG